MGRRVDDDVKVRQIREAAKTLFLRNGFGRVSTAALAEEAGVSKETLYSRFPSKEAVLADVLEHLISAGGFGEVPPPSPKSRDDLRRAFRSLARDLSDELSRREYVELARIVIAETPRLPRAGETFRQAVPERAFVLASGLIAAGREAGLVRDVDQTAAARMFVGPLVVHTLMNVLLVAPRDDEAPAPPMDVDTHVELFLAAIAPENA